MSETTNENSMDQYNEALENVKTLKTAASEAKAELRKFKKANKIRKADQIKDDEVKAEFTALEEAVTTTQDALEEAKTAAQELKPVKQRGGGGTYGYGQIKDAETGEMRDLTSKEKKKWRTHARKVAKKEEGVASAVPFDPTYFDPKPAKKAEPKEEAPAADAETDAPAPASKKRRKAKAE